MSSQANERKEIWVIAETGLDGAPADSTFELIGKAVELAKKREAKVCALVYGKGLASIEAAFAGWGLSKIYVLDRPELDFFHDEPIAQAIATAASKYAPETILGPATVRGRSLLPRIAALLGAGLTADCTCLEIDEKTGRLLQTRPAFGGNLLATIVSETFPQMSTVRPHVFKKGKPSPNASAVEVVDIASGWTSIAKKPLGIKKAAAGGVSLSDAKAIVAVGMGVGGPKGVAMAKELAAKLGAALAATRSVVDSGWLDYSHQVGQTGITVHPKLYVAVGISGAIQHLVGMQGAEYVVSINKDAEAPILSVSDLALKGDVADVLPTLISKL